MKKLLLFFVFFIGLPPAASAEIPKPTPEQNRIFAQQIKPFIEAYYGGDYQRAYRLGKTALGKEPHNYRDAAAFKIRQRLRDAGADDGIAIIERRLISAALLRVDPASSGKYFYVTISYQVVSEGLISLYRLDCRRMEFVLFHVAAEKFDGYAGMEDLAYDCRAAKRPVTVDGDN